MKNAHFRPMTVEDVKAVAALEREVFSDPWSEASFRREVEEGGDTSWLRVVEEGPEGRLLGYCVAWFVADEVHLANVAVVPDARRRGLAQGFLEELLEAGRVRGGRIVVLEVRRSNLAAQALYRRNGFFTVMIRRGYYRNDKEDALVMIKHLSETDSLAPDGKRQG